MKVFKTNTRTTKGGAMLATQSTFGQFSLSVDAAKILELQKEENNFVLITQDEEGKYYIGKSVKGLGAKANFAKIKEVITDNISFSFQEVYCSMIMDSDVNEAPNRNDLERSGYTITEDTKTKALVKVSYELDVENSLETEVEGINMILYPLINRNFQRIKSKTKCVSDNIQSTTTDNE